MQRFESECGQDSITVSTECPTVSIDFLLGRIHVGETDASMLQELDLAGRSERATAKGAEGWSAEKLEEAEGYAIWRHRENGGLYRDVWAGALGASREL